MPTLRELIIKTVMKSEKAVASSKKLDTSLDKVGKSVKKLQKDASGLTGQLKSMFLGFATFGGLVGFTKGVIETNTNAQKLAATMKTLAGGNAEVAQANVEMIREFAVKTPFALGEITEAFIKFKAAGIDPTAENLKRAGDFAAATGTNISLAADAITKAKTNKFAQVTSEMKVSVEKLGDSVRLTFGKKGEPGFMERVVKKGPAVSQALLEMGDNFPEGMSNQLETLGGKFSNLGDATTAFRVRVGQAGFNDALIELLGLFIDVTGESTTLADAVGKTLAAATRSITKAIKFLRANFEKLLPIIKLVGAAVGAKVFNLAGGVILKVASSFNILKISALKAQAAVLLVPAAIGALLLLIEDIFVFLQGGDSLIGEFLGRLEAGGGEGAELAKFIRTTIVEMFDALKKLLPVIMKLGKALLGAVMKLLPAIVQIIGAVALIIAQLVPVVVPIIEELVEVIIELLDQILPVILELVRTVLPVIVGLIRELMPVFKAVMPIIVGAIKVIAKAISGVVMLISLAVEGFGYLFDAIASVGDIFSVLWDEFEKTFPNAAALIETTLDTIGGLFEDIKNFVGGIIDDLLSPIEDEIRALKVLVGLEGDEKQKEDFTRFTKSIAINQQAAAGGGVELDEAAKKGLHQLRMEDNILSVEAQTAIAKRRRALIEQGQVLDNMDKEEQAIVEAVKNKRQEIVTEGPVGADGSRIIGINAAGAAKKGGDNNVNVQQGGVTINMNGQVALGEKELRDAATMANDANNKRTVKQLRREVGRGGGE
jgi:phage-related protein